MGKKYEFTADKQARAASFLSIAVPGLSRAAADVLVKSGEVRVNGKRVTSNVTLEPGDAVSVFVPDKFNRREAELTPVYSDENIVIFDKPKRLPYDAIPELYGQKVYAVHRLDVNTSGLIAFAKTQSAQDELTRAFKERRVEKEYEAVVYPAPQKPSDTLVAYTRLLHSQDLALVSAEKKAGYKQMITEYEVKRRIGEAALLRIKLHTGRTHQIRAHLLFIGSPIVGDGKYYIKGKKMPGAPDSQMLAAVRLVFNGLKGGLEYLNGREFTAENGFDLSFCGGSQE